MRMYQNTVNIVECDLRHSYEKVTKLLKRHLPFFPSFAAYLPLIRFLGQLVGLDFSSCSTFSFSSICFEDFPALVNLAATLLGNNWSL